MTLVRDEDGSTELSGSPQVAQELDGDPYVGTGRISQPTALQLGTQVRIGKTILELRK